MLSESNYIMSSRDVGCSQSYTWSR